MQLDVTPAKDRFDDHPVPFGVAHRRGIYRGAGASEPGRGVVVDLDIGFGRRITLPCRLCGTNLPVLADCDPQDERELAAMELTGEYIIGEPVIAHTQRVNDSEYRLDLRVRVDAPQGFVVKPMMIEDDPTVQWVRFRELVARELSQEAA